MNNFSIKNIIWPCLLVAALLLPKAAKAADLIDVNFSATPLFNEADFAPGDTVPRGFEVTNRTSSPLKAYLNLDPYDDPSGVGSKFDVVVKESGNVNPIFSGTMQDLASSSSVVLSSALPPGTPTAFEMSVTFNPDAGDKYQSQTLKFDVVITASAENGSGDNGGNGGNGGGGSSGGGVYPNNPSGGEVKGTETNQLIPSLTYMPPELPALVGRIGGAATTRGVAATVANGEVLGTSTEQDIPAAVTAVASGMCRQIKWWPLGYLAYAILLFLAAWQFRSRNLKLKFFIPAVLLLAGIAWWYFEPCGRHILLWPLLMIVLFAACFGWLFGYGRPQLPPPDPDASSGTMQ